MTEVGTAPAAVLSALPGVHLWPHFCQQDSDTTVKGTIRKLHSCVVDWKLNLEFTDGRSPAHEFLVMYSCSNDCSCNNEIMAADWSCVEMQTYGARLV